MAIHSVADFIRAGDAPRDLAPALRRVAAAVADGDTISFPAGDWNLSQEAAEQTLLAVTNHDTCVRNHGLLLTGKKDITIAGNGATLFADGLVVPLWIEGCDQVAIRDLTLDWSEPLNAMGIIDRVDVDHGVSVVDLTLDPSANPRWSVWGKRFRLNSPFHKEELKTVFEWDVHNRYPAFGSADNCGGDYSVRWDCEKLGDDRLRMRAAVKHVPTAGNQLMLRCAHRYAPVVVMSRSNGITCERVAVHAGGGMAFIGQRCRDVTLRECVVAPSPRRWRLDADVVDASHFSNCAGHILIEDCRFENQLDDPTNVHGAYFPIVRRVDAHTVRLGFGHPQQAGAPVGGPGDRFELCSKGPSEAYWTGVAAEVTELNHHSVEVRFVEELPKDLKVGDGFDNIDWYPDLTLQRCHMRGNRARGPLISTRGKVVIDNNYFLSPGAGIQMAGGVGGWYESGPVHDCIITNNHFDRCAYNAPIWGSAVFQLRGEGVDGAARTEPYHRNITIANNRITCSHDRLLDCDSVGNLTWTDNVIEKADDYREGVDFADQPGEVSWAKLVHSSQINLPEESPTAAVQ